MRWLAMAVFALPLIAADSIEPVRVCTVLENVTVYEGKVVAVVGRYSFRQTGRDVVQKSMSEEKCGTGPGVTIHIAFDKKTAAPTPEHLEMDGMAVGKLLKSVQQQTSLAKFKFGTPDYDRWAVVYGRIESGKGSPDAPAQIVCAGDSVVVFLVDRQ